MEANLIEVTHHANLVMIIFLIGYTAIVVEQFVKFNKAATALLMAIACWTILFLEPYESVERHLTIFTYQMFKVSQVLFFLLGALTIVEIINVHKGFQIITDRLVTIHSKRKMLWIIAFVTFFLSSVLDNLTTTIVMISLVAKIIEDKHERWLLGGVVVIAANSGGAWTPIGDVATTLLWISGQITTVAVIRDLFLPSVAGVVACLLWMNMSFHGTFASNRKLAKEKQEPGANWVLALGVCCLIFVPIFKVLTDLPAFMGMMLGLGIMWLVTDLMHSRSERHHLQVVSILPKVDISIIMFYLGVLLSINALESAGLLKNMANWLDSHVFSPLLIPILIGLISSVVDNVSLVAATIGMYDLKIFGTDAEFWQVVAYCSGTGGSILIVGSAAGVALMALEKMDFMWYAKKITFPALLAYFGGLGTYFLTRLIFPH